MRLGLFTQLAFYRRYRCFPNQRNGFAPSVIVHLAEQIDAPVATLNAYYQWHDPRRATTSRLDPQRLDIGPFDEAARDAFRTWLMTDALPREPKAEALEEWINDWLTCAQVDARSRAWSRPAREMDPAANLRSAATRRACQNNGDERSTRNLRSRSAWR